MNLREILLNKWVEFGGGSRLGTNKLRFTDLGEQGIMLTLRYVFDWETREIENMNFFLSHSEFDQLIGQLLREEHATLEKKDERQELLFEWKLVENHIFFRLSGRATSELGNHSQYQMLDFERLIENDINNIIVS